VKVTTHGHFFFEVKTAWSYASTPSRAFIIWCFITHRNNFAYCMIGTLRNPNMNPKPNTICNPFPVAVEWLTSVAGIHKCKASIIRPDSGKN